MVYTISETVVPSTLEWIKWEKWAHIFTRTPILEKPFGTSDRTQQYVASISASMGAVCAGSALAWSSPALPQLSIPPNITNLTSLAESNTLVLTTSEQAIVGSVVTIGALIAAIPAGILADKIGRKLTILLLALSFMLSWILIILATSAATLVAARIFSGIGLGGICVLAPMYIGEIAEDSMRGTLASFFQIFLCLGILITFIIGSIVNYVYLSLSLMIVSLIFGISFYFMPETYVYLVKRNRMQEAEESLSKLRGGNSVNYNVQAELKVIEREVAESQKSSASFKELITSKSNIKAVIAILGVMAYQQLCGINAVVFYTVDIFAASGSTLSPNVSAIIISVVQCLGAYTSMYFIERAPRRFFLLLSTVGMFICLCGLGLFFHLQRLKINPHWLSFLPLGSAILFMISFTFGYGGVPWMLMHELLAPNIRGVASGMAVVSNWFCAFLVTFFFPIMINDLGSHITFYTFAIIIASSTLFVVFVVPETKGKSMKEVQDILSG